MLFATDVSKVMAISVCLETGVKSCIVDRKGMVQIKSGTSNDHYHYVLEQDHLACALEAVSVF